MCLPARVNEALQWFGQARKNERLAHAYLVVGSPHGDARRFVEQVLPLLLCETDARAGAACGVCSACRRVRERRHQDVIQIEPQGKSCTIPVEILRNLQHQFGQTALSGGRKIAVIWGAERLGAEAANAFLKTLEEPPPGSIFFLITPAPASVLETVRSRCQRMALSEPEIAQVPDAWQPYLDAIMDGLEPNDDKDKAAWEGLAAAHRFLALCKTIRKQIEDTEENQAGENDDQDAVTARVAARFAEQRAAALQALQLWYRDIMLAHCGADPSLFRYGERQDTVRQIAGRLGLTGIINKIAILERLHRNLESNIPDGVVVHTAFAELTAGGNYLNS